MALTPKESIVFATHQVYEETAKALFPQTGVSILAVQGGCSTTFLLNGSDEESQWKTPDRIVQFREPKFGLNLDISAAAQRTYERYAPCTKQLSTAHDDKSSHVLIYEMDVIPGISYNLVVPTLPHLTSSERSRQMRLVEDFADFVSRAWPDQSSEKLRCNGKVGSQISCKLERLAKELPSANLRAIAQRAIDGIGALDLLPVVLNHGDVNPSNMMVDSDSGALNGLVDWAEAEYLPFGICLYGVEYLFGFLPVQDKRDSLVETRRFQYYTCSKELRCLFWHRLRTKTPALDHDERLLKAVVLSKSIGTLLWNGFAWDDGAIDRVVNNKDDSQEMAYLECFLCHDLDEAAS